MKIADDVYDIKARARIEGQRVRMNETMAAIFDEVDFVFASTNPDVAFGCEGPLPTTVNGQNVGPGQQRRADDPVEHLRQPRDADPGRLGARPPRRAPGAGRHHQEPLLLELARIVEQERPWPLTAPA